MLWRFANAVPAGMMTQRGADRLFIPREGRVTGVEAAVLAQAMMGPFLTGHVRLACYVANSA
jgi:hypothetical protein